MTTDSHRAGQSGFTLVEIAVVLVIIGLILGGVLKGQEMISQARIKSVINDLSGISAAMYGYQDRYRALPGDDKSAASRWASATSGNGDGVIMGMYFQAPPATDESSLFWEHLRLAGFIAGSGRDQPFNAHSGKIGIQTSSGVAETMTTGVLGSVGPPAVPAIKSLILCSANLPDKIAISVDAQLDDGVGTTGSIRAERQLGAATILTTGNGASGYVETGTNTYVVCGMI